MRSKATATLAVMLVLSAGCSWVQLSDAGAGVAQASASEVGGCRLVGNVSASTQDRLLFERSRGKVAEELIVMARNEAAALGGDTLVPAGPMQQGNQDFQVYRCH